MMHTWLKGTVKAVLSGDTMVVMGNDKNGPPLEKMIKLAGIRAPKLGGRDRMDEPFAWESRESLRKKCVGKEVTFKVEISLARRINIEICTVALKTLNIAFDVIKDGWAFVRPQGDQTPNQMIDIQWTALKEEEGKAKRNALGIWNMKLKAREAAIRQLPPSGVGNQSTFDAIGFFNTNKGRALPAIVEHVRDGNTIHVYFLPGFHYIQIFVAGVKAPSMGSSAPIQQPDSRCEAVSKSGGATKISEESLKSPEKLATKDKAATCLQVAHEPFSQQAKHFTEVNVLNRDVSIILTGVHKGRNLIGSVHYTKNTFMVDLALELVKKGLATLLGWSVNMMDEEPKHVLQAAEFQAKQEKIGLWYNYAPRTSNSIAIVDLHFSGKVTEIVSGDCIMVLEDDTPSRSPPVELRVYLSGIRAPRVGDGRTSERLAYYSLEAKEFLRSQLIGQQVNVTMEYSCKLPQIRPGVDARSMEFGSVHFVSSSIMGDAHQILPISGSDDHQIGINVAVMVLLQGLANVVKHGDFEDRSKFYDKLLAAEHQAQQTKKGMHSDISKPASQASTLKTPAKDVFSHLSGSMRTRAIVDYIFNGQKFRLLIPKLGGVIYFCLSGIQCPAHGKPFYDEAFTFARRKIMQREVEIEVQTFQNFSGTFLGTLWEGELNISIALLKAGLAKLHPRFSPDWATEGELMVHSERLAKNQQLKIWEGFVKFNIAEENKNTYAMKLKQQVHKICITVVLGGGKFYGRILADASIQGLLQELENFEPEKLRSGGIFSPRKGDIVLAHVHGTNSWNRALVVNAQQQLPESGEEEFEVFCIDWGTQEFTQISEMRPAPKSLSAARGLAQLYCLADVTVPEIDDKNGLEAAVHLFKLIDGKELVASVKAQANFGDQVASQGTGPCLMVTLFTANGNSNINDLMVRSGLAMGMTKSEMEHT